MAGITAQHRRRGDALESAILEAAWAEVTSVEYAQLTMEGVAARARTPDTGTLRGDVLSVLRTFIQRYQDFGPDVVHGLMSEARELRPELTHVVEATMTTILKRAADRGEIRAEVITPRLATLPADLLRHEMLLTSRQISDGTLTEIVDDVFLPLVRR